MFELFYLFNLQIVYLFFSALFIFLRFSYSVFYHNLLTPILSSTATFHTGSSRPGFHFYVFICLFEEVRKSWKRRWFVLDARKGCVAYFEDHLVRQMSFLHFLSICCFPK